MGDKININKTRRLDLIGTMEIDPNKEYRVLLVVEVIGTEKDIDGQRTIKVAVHDSRCQVVEL